MDITSEDVISLTNYVETWRRNMASTLKMSPAGLRHIEVLGDRGGMTPTDIARLHGVSTGSETVIINRLMNEGLVTLTQNSRDRRSKFVALSAQGQKLYEYYAGQRKEFIEHLQRKDFVPPPVGE